MVTALFGGGHTEPGFDFLTLLLSLERHHLFCPCVCVCVFFFRFGRRWGWVGIKCFTHGKWDETSKEGYAV